jgi:adenylylsulfate kinase-like enzyme
LLITGTVGSGKTTVADAVGELLVGRGTPHAVVDLDQLRLSWPPPAGDRFNNAMELANLASVAQNYWTAGARRLVMAGVIERRSALPDYERAVGCAVTVVRLRARGDVLAARLHDRHRHDPKGLSWHLSRAPELDAILDQAAVADAEVDTTEREPVDAAAEVLAVAGW